MQKLILILATILIITNPCVGQSDIDSKQIEKYFDKEERKELVNIISFVDSLVLSKTDSKDIDKAYHQYLDLLYENAANGDWNKAFDEKMKYNFLFNIKGAVFSKIWQKLTTARIVKTRDTTLYNPENFISIDLNNTGEFVRLINDFGENNTYYKEFAELIEINGGLSPYLWTKFIYNHKEFDFNIIDNRLWAAIFLLTIEESADKKVDRYLNE